VESSQTTTDSPPSRGGASTAIPPPGGNLVKHFFFRTDALTNYVWLHVVTVFKATTTNWARAHVTVYFMTRPNWIFESKAISRSTR